MNNYKQQAQSDENSVKPTEYRPFNSSNIGADSKETCNYCDSPHCQQKDIDHIFPFYHFVNLSCPKKFCDGLYPFPVYANVHGKKQSAGSSNNKVKSRVAFPPDKREDEKNRH